MEDNVFVFCILVRSSNFTFAASPDPETEATVFIGGLFTKIFEHLINVFFLIFAIIGFYLQTVIDDCFETIQDLHDVILLIYKLGKWRICCPSFDLNLRRCFLTVLKELIQLIQAILFHICLLVGWDVWLKQEITEASKQSFNVFFLVVYAHLLHVGDNLLGELDVVIPDKVNFVFHSIYNAIHEQVVLEQIFCIL